MATTPTVAPAAASEPSSRIVLRGASRIDAHVARAKGRLLLSGSVTSDIAQPLAQARVALVLSRDGEGIALANAAPATCGRESDSLAPPTAERADTLVLPADDAGRFCVSLSLPIDRYVAHLEARALGLVDGSKLDVPIDLALTPVTLRFDPEPSIVELDDPVIAFDVVATTESDAMSAPASGLQLSLSDEEGRSVGSATSNATGRVRFVVDAARVGAPGRGRLVAAFRGSTSLGPASAVAMIERRTWVDISVSDAKDGRLPPVSPGEAVAIRVTASARCARLGCSGTPTGAIEVYEGNGIAGAAALEHGEAKVVARVTAPANGAETLRLRYAPDAPWFQARGELTLSQPSKPPSPWHQVPLLAAAAFAMAWLVLARLAPRSRPTVAAAAPVAAPPGPRIEVVRTGQADQGWLGRLRDTHDGSAVAAAQVTIERRGFDGVEVIARTSSDADGAFRLAALSTRPGDELVAEGPLHAPFRSALPAPGVLDIALVLRKRALLEPLVRWARRRGHPFDAPPEPTPGHVQRAAGAEQAVAHWAEAVESAAYGDRIVDSVIHSEIEGLAPADAQPAPDSPEHVDGARRRSL